MELYGKDLYEIAKELYTNDSATKDVQEESLKLINEKITNDGGEQIIIENQQDPANHIGTIGAVSMSVTRIQAELVNITDPVKQEESFSEYFVSGMNIVLSTYGSFDKIPLAVMLMIINEFVFSFEKSKKKIN